MKIIVADTNIAVCNAASEMGYDVYHGSILDLDVDAVVSPANSFGFMDGGVDLAYTRFFGIRVQQILQEYLVRDREFAELLIGEAVIINTDYAKIPYIICAPTMRVPKKIHDPFDITLAARAAYSQAKKNNLKSIAFPGMGTGCGCVPAWVFAKAFHAGIMAVDKPMPFPVSIQEIVERHHSLRTEIPEEEWH